MSAQGEMKSGHRMCEMWSRTKEKLRTDRVSCMGRNSLLGDTDTFVMLRRPHISVLKNNDDNFSPFLNVKK